MRTARKPADRGHRLMLVQGGVDDTTPGDGGEDWQDFCRRIGWQPPAPEAEDNLEERLSERLFAKATSEDNVVRLDLVRAARAAVYVDEMTDVDLAPISETFRLRSAARLSGADRSGASEREPLSGSAWSRAGWGRVSFAAAASFAVAAVVFFLLGRWAVSTSPSASFPAVSAEIAPRATVTPRFDHAVEQAPTDALPPTDLAPPRRAPRHEAKTVKPSPSPKAAPPATPEPPGTAVAWTPESDAPARELSARRAGASDVAGADRAKIEASPDSPAGELDVRVADLDVPAAAFADSSVNWGVVPRYRSGLPGAETVALAAVPARANVDVWSNSAHAPATSDMTGARSTSASWSLSSATDRWLGASVTPLLNASQASVGAMVQLDLGKAFSNL